MPGGCRFFLWEGDPQAGIGGLDPERLERLDPLWRKDCELFGPWDLVSVDFPPFRPAAGRLWKARKSTGDRKALICGACPSAMDAGWGLAEESCLLPWDALIAVSQQAGRGRHQRSWASPAGNLYAAWRWPAADTGALRGRDGLAAILAGFLLAEYLSGKGSAPRIKWPNDVLLNSRKTGGVLVEKRREDLLVGIGLNLAVYPGDECLRDDFSVSATSLHREGIEISPLSFWSEFIEFGRDRLRRMALDEAPEDWLAAFSERLAWVGRTVRVKSGKEPVYTATLLGLAPDGGLRLQKGGAVQVIYSGSLLPA
jgi:BirA family biotin operon repressor/biotin-[acetyl-CoA-carboxylase] ligase